MPNNLRYIADKWRGIRYLCDAFCPAELRALASGKIDLMVVCKKENASSDGQVI